MIILGSEWTLLRLRSVQIDFGSYKPLSGQGYTPRLPPCLKNRHSILNIKNKLSSCFKLTIIAAKYGNEIKNKLMSESGRKSTNKWLRRQMEKDLPTFPP